MTRTLPAVVLLVAALLGTSACSENSGSGDSNPSDTESQVPAPVPTS